MAARRALRLTTATIVGVVGGTILALVAVAAVLLVALHVFSTSGAEHARKEVQAQFGRVAHVDGCRKVVSDPVEPEYRCAVTASSCTRSYLFALAHEFAIYTATPAAKSGAIFDRPCSVPSDR